MPRYGRRYGRRRGRAASGPPGPLDKAWLWSWAVSTFIALVFFLSSSMPRDERISIAFFIFLAPVLLLVVAGIVVSLVAWFPVIICIWGPLGIIAAIYVHLTPPSDTRDLVTAAILGAPFLLLYAYFGGAITLMWAYFGVVLLQTLFYTLLFWRWVFCRPRFRSRDPFAETKLCEDCRANIAQSGLIFGRWTFLTKANEYYRHVFSSVQPSLPGGPKQPPHCHLCRLLKMEHGKLVSRQALAKRAAADGTDPFSRGLLESEKAATMFKISTATWGLGLEKRYSIDPDCYLEVLLDGEKDSRTKLSITQRALSPLVEPRLTSTGSAAVTAVAKQWLRSCSKHRACQTLSDQTFVPTRLLYVGRSEQPVCRLVDENVLGGQPVQYFALSHCWGKDVRVTLTVENYSAMKERIEVKTLSRNFQEAIVATRALDVEYLWVDSLCIIQNSPEKADWNRESALMMDVFANAACTISATASASSQGGCFRDRMGDLSSCRLVTSSNSELRIDIPSEPQTIGELFKSRVEAAPITKRGWVFQERLLSRRIIHFCSDMVLFECNTLQASEKDIRGSNYEKVPYLLVSGRIKGASGSSTSTPSPAPVRVNVDSSPCEVDGDVRDQIAAGNYEDHSATRGIRGALDTLLSINTLADLTMDEKLAFNRRWFELVEAYSCGALTKSSDKLIAIAGVAGLVGKTSHAKYLAGIWSNVAPELGLLWRVAGWPLTERQRTSVAPTWSWASLDGQVCFSPDIMVGKSERIALQSRVREVNILPSAVMDGRLERGFLELEGPTIQCSLKSRNPYHITDTRFALDLPIKGGKTANSRFWIDCEEPTDLKGGGMKLIAIIIATAKTYSWSSSPSFYGIVVRAARNSVDGEPEFQRVGVFHADLLVDFEGLDEYLDGWKKRRLRVI